MFDATPVALAAPRTATAQSRWRDARQRRAIPTAARVSGLDRTWRLGWVHDLSRGGVGLVLGRAVEPGAELDIELLNRQAIARARVRARVAHVTPGEDDRWLISCTFLTPLAEHEVAALL